MSAYTTGDGWKPAVELDLETASTQAFQDAISHLTEWSASAPPLGRCSLASGWHDITPEISQDLARRNEHNRRASLATVKKYYRAMKRGDWKPTGQPILVNQAGILDDGAHRVLAGYFGKMTFPSYVVADVQVLPEMFAYLDDCKPRSAADALYTSGNNGLSSTIAQVIKLAWRWDAGALSVMSKQPRVQDASIPEVLEYAKARPEMRDYVHLLVSNFGKAANVIGDKAVAALFLWKAAELHGIEKVRPFLVSIGGGANLDADSPILGFRERLRDAASDEDEDMPKERRLALLIKAFNLHIAGKKVGQRGLYVRDNEKFPQIDPQPMAVAAE